MGLVAFFSLRLPRQKGEDLAAKYYLLSCKALARRGVRRSAGETPEQFLARVKVESPCWFEWLAMQTQLFSECSYCSQQSENYLQILQKLKRFRRPRKWLEQTSRRGLER